jgi:hypothetical protein
VLRLLELFDLEHEGFGDLRDPVPAPAGPVRKRLGDGPNGIARRGLACCLPRAVRSGVLDVTHPAERKEAPAPAPGLASGP